MGEWPWLGHRAGGLARDRGGWPGPGWRWVAVPARRVIRYIDIWRVANLMLKRHGSQAEAESDRRAGEVTRLIAKA